MDDRSLRQVRSFNRVVAERIGALSDRFLGRNRPVGAARLLWEIGEQGAEVRELRERLSLDSGYMSRLLRALERDRLISVTPGADDRRVRRAHLTRAGRVERSELDRRSEDIARGILAALTEAQRSKLVAAMHDVERLLTATMITIDVERPGHPDARWCVSQYFQELASRFDAGFDPSLSISADDRELTPPKGLLLIARLRGKPIACGALKLRGRAPAELKRMWVAPAARGLGIGARMLRELEAHARKARVSTVRLETNRTLAEAIALYRANGYSEVPAFNDERYAHHWFEKRLARSSRRRRTGNAG